MTTDPTTPANSGRTTWPEPRLNQEELSAVLKRAIDLDSARAEGISLMDIERLAAELEISPESVSQALAEWRSGTTPASPNFLGRARAKGWGISALVLGAAAIGGALLGGKSESANFWLLLATAAAAIPYRRAGWVREYYQDLVSLWVGFGFGWFLASAFQSEADTLFHLFAPGVAAAALGWCFMRLRWTVHTEVPPAIPGALDTASKAQQAPHSLTE